MRHKHYDLIVAWANGAPIQKFKGDRWVFVRSPNWDENTEYRIRPQLIPKNQQSYTVA